MYYNLRFENHTQIALDTFMIQFNKNTFGIAAGGPLQVSPAVLVIEACRLNVGIWRLPCGFLLKSLRHVVDDAMICAGSCDSTSRVSQHAAAHGSVPKCVRGSSELGTSSGCEEQSTACMVLHGQDSTASTFCGGRAHGKGNVFGGIFFLVLFCVLYSEKVSDNCRVCLELKRFLVVVLL